MNHTPLTDEHVLHALRKIDTCMVSNAIETFDIRLRNTGFANANIRCMFKDFPPMVGYAATARLRSGDPPMSGRIYRDRADWWNSILKSRSLASSFWRIWISHPVWEHFSATCTPPSSGHWDAWAM